MEPGRVDVNLPEDERADAEPRDGLEALDDRPLLEALGRTLQPPLFFPIHDGGELRLEAVQTAGGYRVVAANNQTHGGVFLPLLEGGFGPLRRLEIGDVRKSDLCSGENTINQKEGSTEKMQKYLRHVKSRHVTSPHLTSPYGDLKKYLRFFSVRIIRTYVDV